MNLKSFTALVTAIAHELGGKANMEFANENHFYAHVDTPALPITLDANKGKLTAKVHWPEWSSKGGGRNFFYYDSVVGMMSQEEINATNTEMSCSLDKTPEQIAQSIQRRLIAKAQIAYGYALKRCQDSQEYYNGRQALIESLSKQFNVRIPRHGGETLYFDGFELQVNSADSVSFHRLSVSAELAKKIIALVQSEEE